MSQSKSHHHLLIIFGYVALVLVLGAILAPALFFAGQSVIQSSPNGMVAKILDDKEFSSYFNRAALIVAIFGLWPLFKSLHITRQEVLGSEKAKSGWGTFLTGFFLAAILLFAMGFGFQQFDAYRFRPDAAWFKIFKPLSSALTVGIIEEFLFRGAIFSVLCRSLGAKAGLWWTTLLFATVHFLQPPDDGALLNANVTWTSGFWVIGQLFRGFGEVDHFLAEFCTLMAVGWALGQVRVSSGGLWGSIGLHAGWVFGLKYFGQLTKNSGSLKRGEWLPWIGSNLKVGLTPLIVVVLTGLIMLWIIHKRRAAQEKSIAISS